MFLKVKPFKVNDSTACLFTGISEHPSTRIGIIIGSGFNISFINSDNDDVFEEGNNFQIINTEIGRDPRTSIIRLNSLRKVFEEISTDLMLNIFPR